MWNQEYALGTTALGAAATAPVERLAVVTEPHKGGGVGGILIGRENLGLGKDFRNLFYYF